MFKEVPEDPKGDGLTFALEQMDRYGIDQAMLGYVTEGAASNIFLVCDDTLLAPPKDHLMLPGITYDLVLELAHANAIPFLVRAIREQELLAAQEIMMTSSTREVLAISTLNGKAVGNGTPGPVARRLLHLYRAYIAALPTAGTPQEPQ